MKTICAIIISCFLSMNYVFGQITLDHTYYTDQALQTVKFSLSGVKYCAFQYDTSSPWSLTYFVLYNADHSVFKTINVPQVVGTRAVSPSFISETLFDLDSLVEYIVFYQDLIIPKQEVKVLNENGNVLLAVDSANFSSHADEEYFGYTGKPIIYDGTQAKLILVKLYPNNQGHSVVYNLPGQQTCVDCYNGIVNAIAQPRGIPAEETKSLAYPNPSDNYVKIKYMLPANYNRAVVNLLDITGKLIKKKEIGRHYDEVYITNEELKQGAYIYQIVVDDKITGSGKIIKL